MPELLKKYPLKAMALFGSAVRDDYEAGKSDVDILVDFSSSDAALFFSLGDELESILSAPVDIITFRSLKERQWNYLKDKVVYV